MEQKAHSVSDVESLAGNVSEAESDGVRAVERAIAVLRVFAHSQPRLSVTEVAAAVGLNKSTAHRLLKTLERADFVAQDPITKLYRLGLGLSELGYLAVDTIEVTEVAHPHLVALHRRCGEAIHLGVPEEDAVVYVGKIESANRSIRLNSRLGKRAPLHCTGLGKAILAFLPDSQLATLINHWGLQRYTPTTITSQEALREEMALTRRRGYALDNGEYNELVRCVAAPVFDRTGGVVAAISVTTVAVDIQSHRIHELADLVLQAAAHVSAALGYRGVSGPRQTEPLLASKQLDKPAP